MTGFVVLAVANVVIGAIGTHAYHLYRNRNRREAVRAEDIDASVSGVDTPIPSSDELANCLATVMRQVEGDLSRHAFEVDEISEELGTASPNDPASVMGAAASMLIANRRLQSELVTAQEEIQRQRQRVDALAAELRIDLLTGLANRRSFDEELARRLDLWKRHKVPFSLLLIDVDGFTEFNNSQGRAVADAALAWLARTQIKALRRMDLAARYDGEKFGVILPGIKLTDAANVAERLRGTIASEAFQANGQSFPLTISIGVATTLPDDDNGAIIARADEALRTAKRQGRNRVFSHNGNQAAVIQSDTSAVRHAIDSLQLVAEYRGGTEIPPLEEFSPMRARDISARGISFICDSAPQCKAFVVRLGVGDTPRYMVANVAFVARFEDEVGQYCVGCAFVARLESEGAQDDPRPSEQDAALELAAC